MIFDIITLIIFFAVVLLCYMRIEVSLLDKSYINFSTSKNGLKIAHISDLHVNRLYISAKRIKASLAQINPDIIIMSGDYIESEKDIPEFITLLKEINSVCPVYLSLGNHDHKAFKHVKAFKNANKSYLGEYSPKSDISSETTLLDESMSSFISKIQETGATVLVNSNTSLIKNNTTYNLIGIDDLRHGKPDVDIAFDGITPSKNCINVVFSHNPDIIFKLPKEKADYLLCGHFHGGQIWMPFGLEFKIMRNEKLCKMGYTRGKHKINGINIYINRGIGNVVFPFRFLSKPEIAIIQLP